MKIKHYELVAIANEFVKDNYGLEFDIPIEFNSRIKKVAARFMFTKSKKPVKIEISIDFMMNQPRENIIDILKHELVHYVLCRLGKPFDDGHPIFENELKKHGVKSTNSYTYLGELHVYTCEDCGKTYERKRRLAKTAYCGCQKGVNIKFLRYDGIIHKKPDNMVAFTQPGLPVLPPEENI